MTLTVYKFPVVPEFTLGLPPYAAVLCVQVQGGRQLEGGRAVMWVLGNFDEPARVERRFLSVGTGHPIETPFNCRYISTWQLDELVFHTFEVLS